MPLTRRFAIPVGITATGQFYPDRVVTNEDFAAYLDTSDEWITTRVGIKERRWVEPGVASSDLGAKALQMALDRRGIGPGDLDAIIACTVTPDMLFPSTAALIQHKIGAKNVFGYDMNAACCSFLFGLTTGAAFVASGVVKRVAVVGCDIMSSIADKSDRNTVVLFGDGAGAVIVEQVEEGMGILDFEHYLDGAGAPHLLMPGGGSLNPPSHETVDKKMHFVRQNGQEVYKNAVKGMSDVSRLMIDRNKVDPVDVRLFVAHQANARIIEAVAKRLEMPMERVAMNIVHYANTTSATIPTALHQSLEKGALKKGELAIFAAFGAGYTCGATLIRWAY
ncbi:MAG: ketoacyl-ACP synthase III [Holophagales bacterium]|nr:ketoacyl-ACP synthase III [Holophagales bacterium]